MSQVAVKRALISVYNKAGLAELAAELDGAGVEIVSTGSTAAAIAAAGVAVTRVEDVTDFPECLDGRVKTLHPGVHAGLLADLDRPEHASQLAGLGIAPYELLVSNLYPFESAVASGAAPAECVEQIDIGGPAMVRAAAKNHARVAVITDPSQYQELAAAVRAGGFTLDQRRRLAAQAFAHTARYDIAIASWFASAYAPDDTAQQTGWPGMIASAWTRREVLRYGENPHQRAALYEHTGAGATAVAGARQLHGKAMSYNNYVDAGAAWRAVYDFTEPCVAIIKHSNPCGIAVGKDIADAHRKAHACDPLSAYGGVIAANGTVTGEMATQLGDVFTEVIAAPAFDDEALSLLTTKKNLRLLCCEPPGAGGRGPVEMRPVEGGLLLQSADRLDAPGDDPATWRLVAGPAVTGETLADLVFAWRACRSVKSNAVLIASGGATIGVGMGQVNRVDSARLAVARGGDRVRGAVAASDAYFPFADGLEVLTDAGVTAVVEPGGSVRDPDVIASAQASGVSLYFTGTRHFFH